MTSNTQESGNLIARPVEIKWHSGLPIFASEAFLETVGDEYGWLGGLDVAGRLRCVIPYTITRKPGFQMARFRVETIALEKELNRQEEKSFLNSSVDYFRSAGADIVLPASNTALLRTYPDAALVAPYGTVIKDLIQPEEKLMSEIHKTFRYNIRSAIRAGVQIKSGMEYLGTAYELIADTLKRSGLSFRKQSLFNRMISGLGESVKVLVADHQGVIQGCMVAPFSEHSAYSWYCGSKAAPVMGAMHLLHWEAIRQFSRMGVKRFNFTGVRINPEKGSKQEGIKNFKMRFGGELVQGYLWKYPIRRLKFAVYSIATYLLMRGDTVRFRVGSELE
jgi:Acetyltransferase (GNAT) domain